ncbi:MULTISPECIES: DUF2892 domain-containing protein [unclassified Flavobacterium]|uniref:YgaP family membrane protein n=1 Tax=unclassified Flavobacterium TaxID=196869 RepID=UPI001F132233|nr:MULTISPECIES: DUF2892 domain-containing protein [unclassified Flavobacterium]UMY64508.1 DUF2892 domain-containing protein [Flavobacterium sp. HJ-32-4]
MKANVGRIDRVIRVLLGLALLLAGVFDWFDDGIVSTIGVVVGVILLVTAAVGFCPLYRFLGVRTTRGKKVVY